MLLQVITQSLLIVLMLAQMVKRMLWFYMTLEQVIQTAFQRTRSQLPRQFKHFKISQDHVNQLDYSIQMQLENYLLRRRPQDSAKVHHLLQDRRATVQLKVKLEKFQKVVELSWNMQAWNLSIGHTLVNTFVFATTIPKESQKASKDKNQFSGAAFLMDIPYQILFHLAVLLIFFHHQFIKENSLNGPVKQSQAFYCHTAPHQGGDGKVNMQWLFLKIFKIKLTNHKFILFQKSFQPKLKMENLFSL